jgi:hypothetical protein
MVPDAWLQGSVCPTECGESASVHSCRTTFAQSTIGMYCISSDVEVLCLDYQP